MNKFLKLIALSLGVLTLTAVILSADEKKDGDKKCPNCPNCPQEQPKALVTGEEKKDGDKKCPNCPNCPQEQPKA